MDEMLYLDSLRKEHAKFCENIQTYTVKCKCCGADAPYLGDVDFSKTCHDRYGKKVFQNTVKQNPGSILYSFSLSLSLPPPLSLASSLCF